jgi:hypothetical protein
VPKKKMARGLGGAIPEESLGRRYGVLFCV